MKNILVVLMGTFLASSSFADSFNVMLWTGSKPYRNERYPHADEFATAEKDLTSDPSSDWKFKTMTTAKDRVAEFFANEIDEYDMIVTCPLTEDISPDYTEKLKKWIENGGALCITDMMYPGNYQYVTRINPKLFLGADICGKHVKRYREPDYGKTPDPFAFLPNYLKHQFCDWGHMWLPGEPVDWKKIRTCSCKEMTVLAWRYGKGYIYCSGVRDGRAILLENLRANLEMQRAGFYIDKMEGLDAYKLKVRDYNVKFKIKSNDNWNGKLVWELLPLDEEVKGMGKPKAEKFESSIKMVKGYNDIDFKFSINTRGKCKATLKLVGSGSSPSATLISKFVEFAPLAEVKGSRYRDIVGVSEYKRHIATTRFPVKIVAKNDKIAYMSLSVAVRDKNGNIKGTPLKNFVPTKSDFLVDVKTGRLSPGKYFVHYMLKEGGVKKVSGKTEFTVMDEKECPVYINEDFNTVYYGKEIFPLGIYHIAPAEYDKAKELGFNTVQTWFGYDGVFKAQEKGLYTIFETFGRENDIDKAIAATNLIFWYAFDEPRENNFYTAVAAKELYKKKDPFNRPTMMVTMESRAITRMGQYADVIGRDPYFFPGAGEKIAGELEALREEVSDDKPIWHVPQAQWMKDPKMYKNTAFQGIVHGARGIFWYCWDDGKTEKGGIGLKYETHLHDMAKETNEEIKKLTPALLNPDRIQFQSSDKKIDGMICTDKVAKKTYCILVNRFGEENTITFADVPQLKGKISLKEKSKTLGPWEVVTLTVGQR